MDSLQLRIIIMVVIVVGGLAMLFAFTSNTYFDIKDYYISQGTKGPFLVTLGDFDVVLGDTIITKAKAGDVLGWVTTSCFSGTIDGMYTSELVRVSDQVVVAYNVVLGPFSKCGVSIGKLKVPLNTIPGEYIVVRNILLKPARNPPIANVMYPYIHIMIEK